MSGSSWLSAPGRVLDAAVFVVAALLGAVVYPSALPIVALIAALLVVLFSAKHLGTVLTQIGVAGWLILGSALWLSLSGLWGEGGVGSPAIWTFFFAIIGVPAVYLANTSGLNKVSNDFIVILGLALGGLVLFETASGGFLADKIFGAGFQAIYSAIALLLWPMAALLRSHFGWEESAIWTSVMAFSVILGAGPAVSFGVTMGLFFFGLGLLNVTLARLGLIGVILVCVILPPVLGLSGVQFSGIPLLNLPDLGSSDAWRVLVERWTMAPAHGVGSLAVAEGISSIYGNLLLGTGAIGFLLISMALGFSAVASVQSHEGHWTGPAAAATIAVIAGAGLGGLGPFSEWWMASLLVACITLAICRAPDDSGSSLGSIFGAQGSAPPDDETLEPLDYEEDDDFLYEDDEDDPLEDDDDFDPEGGEDGDGFDDEDAEEDEDDGDSEEWSFDPSQFGQDDGKSGR